EERERLALEPRDLLARRQAERAAPDRAARDEAGRAGEAGRLELLGERRPVDLAPPEERPRERRRRPGGRSARRSARVLELQQVAVVELGRRRDDEVGKGVRERPLGLPLERVDERLEDEREAVVVAVVRRARQHLALTRRAGLVVGAIPEQELAAVRARG